MSDKFIFVFLGGGDSTETDNDLLLAQMLQLEFDRENDNYVKSMEKNYNGTSKGKNHYILLNVSLHIGCHKYDVPREKEVILKC